MPLQLTALFMFNIYYFTSWKDWRSSEYLNQKFSQQEMAKARKLIAGLLNTTMPQKIKQLRCEITMYIKQTLYLKGFFDTQAELNNRGIQSIQILEGGTETQMG